MAVSHAGQSQSRQRGIALITVMLIVALATIAAVAMASRQQLDVYRISNLLHGDQAYTYALGVENWASSILRRDLKDNETDNLGEAWAENIPPLPVPGGQIKGYVEDLQGRFNLNSLVLDGKVSKPQLEQFQRLLKALEINEEIAVAVVDWMDVDIDPQPPNGAEDSVYLSEDPPYRAANMPFSSISELYLIQGFDNKVVSSLLPHIAVLPKNSKININTAGATVLRSLLKDLTESDGQRLVDDRGEDGYKSVEDFLQHEVMAGGEIDPNQLTVASEYFLIHADVEVGQARSRLYSLVERVKGRPVVTLARTQVE